MEGTQTWLPGAGLVGLVGLVVLVVAFVFWRRRVAGQRPARPRPQLRPRPGEIWWAEVPYEDGSGAKVRPCLVLRARWSGVEVLKITSQDRRGRHGHVRLPTRRWDPRARKDSYLNVTTPVRVRLGAFNRRAGECDPVVWQGVRQFHRLSGG